MQRVVAAAVAAALGAGCALSPDVPELSPGFGLDEQQLDDVVAELGIGDDIVLVAAGDIARCTSLEPAAVTGDLVDAVLSTAESGLVLTLGDHAYERGLSEEYERCYEPTWGRFEAVTRPTPGNHDYETPDAVPYYEYFSFFARNPGARERGYYAFEVGGWHVVSLNSMLPMTESSAQIEWLENELGGLEDECTLAYWHHPLFSSGRHGINPWDRGRDLRHAWEVLEFFDTEVIVNGHEHIYERFAPQTASGRPVQDGPRQFTVGTGGGDLTGVFLRRRNSEMAYNEGYGVLVLSVHPAAYEWAFIGADGDVHDRSDGLVDCDP